VRVRNKDTLLNLVARAERGALLPGEAQMLREAIESLDELDRTVNVVTECLSCSTGQIPVIKWDDIAPGRP
jgi:hypothetical protein